MSDLDELKILKFYEHPEIRPQIEVKDSKGKDTFDLSDWWKSNCDLKDPACRLHSSQSLCVSPFFCGELLIDGKREKRFGVFVDSVKFYTYKCMYKFAYPRRISIDHNQMFSSCIRCRGV